MKGKNLINAIDSATKVYVAVRINEDCETPVQISKQVAKKIVNTYYNADILVMHLSNNILFIGV